MPSQVRPLLRRVDGRRGSIAVFENPLYDRSHRTVFGQDRSFDRTLKICRNRPFEPTTNGRRSARLVDYWMSSSARSSIDDGMVRFSSRAVLRFIASTNLLID